MFDRKATRKELRAGAPGGLYVEDVLQRIGFDDSIPNSDAFTVLSEQKEHTTAGSPKGSKWCSSFCWTGECRFGDQCWYAHGERRLRLWEPCAETPSTQMPLLPSAKRAPLAPLAEGTLVAARESAHSVYLICFLLYDDRVVWGRDLGLAGVELWNSFVKGWSADATIYSSSDGQTCETGERQRRDTRSHSMDLVRESLDWVRIPQVVWARIAHCLTADDFVAAAVAIPCVDWGDVVAERWPRNSTAFAPVGDCESSSSARVEAVRQLLSLCAASRLVAQLCRWPTPRAHNASVIPIEPNDKSITKAECANLSPMVASKCSCSAVREWALQIGEPAFIPLDGPVSEGCLSLDDSLVVFLARGGDIRAVRRNDLKQVCNVCVREASCLDFVGEKLLIGTCAPARLLAYDLSEARPRAPVSKLRLDSATELAVTILFFTDRETCVCGLAGEASPGCIDASLLREVLLVGCHDDTLSVLQRFKAASVAPLNIGCVTSASDRLLSAWDTSSQAFDPPRGTASLPACAELAGDVSHPFLAGSVASRFVAVAGLGKVAVHDALRGGGEAPRVVRIDAAGEGMPMQLIISDIFVEGTLLLVFAEDRRLASASVPDGSAQTDQIVAFAWHLPTATPLLVAQHLPGHLTVLARLGAGSTNRSLAFAGTQTAGREVHCIVLPCSNAIRVRTGRSTGLHGPVRKVVSSSDARARRAFGMRKR